MVSATILAQNAYPGGSPTQKAVPTTLLTGGSSWQWPPDAYADKQPGDSFLCAQASEMKHLFAVRNRQPPDQLQYPITLVQTGMQQIQRDKYCTMNPEKSVTMKPWNEQPPARTTDLAVAKPTTFLLSWEWEELCEECPPSGLRNGKKCVELEMKPVCDVGFCETHDDLFWCQVVDSGAGTGTLPLNREEL
jgi:hypothetical protein